MRRDYVPVNTVTEDERPSHEAITQVTNVTTLKVTRPGPLPNDFPTPFSFPVTATSPHWFIAVSDLDEGLWLCCLSCLLPQITLRTIQHATKSSSFAAGSGKLTASSICGV